MKASFGPKRRGNSEKAVDATPDAKDVEATELLDPSTAEEDDEGIGDNNAGRRRATEAKSERGTSRLETVERVFRIASLLAISASSVLAAYQFYQGRIDDQKENSVALMSSWQDSEEREAFARLSEKLQERLASLPDLPGQVTPAAMRAVKFRIGDALVDDWTNGVGYEDWEDDVDSLFNFYSEVEFCIRAELCYAPLLKSYFGEDVVSFWEYFRPYAEDRRLSYYPKYGLAVDQLVDDWEN